MRIAKLGVVGAGTMGSGIAALAASAGIPVVLLDVPGPDGDRNAPARAGLERARKARPAAFMDVNRAGLISIGNLDDSLELLRDCDLILEAIIEQPAPKQALYARLEPLLKESAIVASNTSGIPMRILTEGRTDRFKRHFLGMHFFNPPRYLHLLELIPTADTAPEALDAARRFSEIVLGKGIVLAKDVPGFVANRLGVYGMVAAMKGLMESGLTIDEVDALTGPLLGRAKSATFRTADITGLDVLLHVSKGLSASTGEDFSMPEWVEKLAASGRLGDKTQGGFYRKVDKDITTLDWNTLEYGPQQKVEDPALAALMKQPLAQRLKAATAAAGQVRRVRAQLSAAHVALRAEDVAGHRVRHRRRGPRDRVGLRVGRRPLPADGRARPRLPARGLRATRPRRAAAARRGEGRRVLPRGRRRVDPSRPSTASTRRCRRCRARSPSTRCALARAPSSRARRTRTSSTSATACSCSRRAAS